MSGKHHTGWVRPLHIAVVLSLLLAVGGPALQPSQALAAAPEPVSATPSADAPLRPSLAFQASLPQWLTGRPSQQEVPTNPPDTPVADPPEPQPELPHRPPLWAEVEASPAAANAGDAVTLTVRIRSEANLSDAVLITSLPSGLDFLSAPSDRVVFNPKDRTLQWPLGQVLASAAPEFRFRVRMNAAAPDLMVQTIQVHVPGYGGPAIGQVILKRLFPDTQARITPDAGGQLRSADGRVQVVFPPGAVSQPLRVEHKPVQVDLLPAQRGGLALQFQLNAYTDDQAAAPIHQFAKPLELRVDMTGLVNWDDLAPWQYPFLGYLDEKTGEWIPLAAWREGNILVAQLDHFSTLGGGAGNVYETGWLLAFNDAHVSTFTGGLTYDFPIQVPEGRGGLTPDLRLNYNSRRVDGILTWTQADWAGLGWTLDTMSIARRVTPDYTPTNGKPAWYWGPWVGWQNKFTLMYKGTGYKLVPGSAFAYGRYYTEDEQFLYIERRNAAGSNGSPNNTTGEYWIVRLRDGTEYRLGYNADSEQVVATNSYTVPASPNESNYAGNTNGRVAFQWRVDKVTDVHGNVIEFSYQEETTGDPTVRDKASYLTQVRYNYLTSGWGTRITFIRAARSSDGVGDAVDPNSQYYYFYQNDFLQRIKIENWSNGQYNTVREYLLTYDARTVPPGEHNNHTRRLVSIREYGTDGYGGDSLPTTTFGYTAYQNKDWCSTCPEWELWNRESFRYERLTSINNGYGGVISFAYETPDGGWWQAWNYRVSQKTVSDGQSGGSKVTYTYTPVVDQRCYADPMNSEAFGCYFFSPMSTTGGSLVGYGSVTETLKTLADTAIAVTAHKFKLDTLASPDRSKGRELETRRLNDSGTEVQQVISTTWVVSSTTAMTDTYTYFVYAQWVREFTREGNALPSTPQKKTYYAYEPERGGQYGSLTYVLEYQGDTAYRRTRTHFYPNTTAWIVDRPAVITACNASDVPQTITRLYYDGAATYTAPPQRGDVTRKEQTVSVGASPVWITTQTITYKDSSYYYLPYIVADGNGNQTTTTYDSTWKMYPITVTNALGQATTYEYNYVLGKVTKVTGPNGSTTATGYEYDEFGRLTKIIRPGDTSTYPTVRYDYCDTCSPFRILTTQRLVAAGSDIPTLRFYNGIGQLIQENKGTTDRSQMTIANTTYNAQGLVEKSYVPYLATYSTAYQTPDTNQPKTAYAYDALGRVTTVTNPDGTAVRTYYNGLKKAVLDENNHQRIYENDAFGRLVKVNEYTGTYSSGPDWSATAYATTTYAYNTLDLLTTVTDGAGNQTTMTYDALGRKTQMTDPDMGTWSYAYDNASNLTRQTDARNQTICFYYDALNRLKGKHYRSNNSCPPSSNPQLNVGYSYDATAGGNLGIGYRTAMSDTISGSTAWKYDTRGRVISETKSITDGGTFTTQWTYNSADLVATQVYPGSPAETVTTTYDKWGRPSSLAGSNTYVSSATYDVFGRLDVVQFGNGQRTDYDYYPITQKGGRLYEIKTGSTSPYTGTQYLRYDYDSVGNVTSITDFNNRTGNQSQVQSFTYDSLDRLTAASTNAYGADQYSEAYAYDAIGNLTSKAGVSYQYNDTAHKHAVTHLGGVQKYWYDANGNQTRRIVGSDTYDLTYDTENRLTQVKKNGSVIATFAYDGDGNRVKANFSGTVTYYIGNWYEKTGLAETKYYYYFAGRRVAMRTSDGVTHIHGDHLGSATNTTGPNPATQRYFPWGARRSTTELPTPYRFTGQREESKIGLYFYNARWYDPALGRFLQPDTLVPEPGNPQALNRYAYTLNNPLRYTDPSGHCPWCVAGKVLLQTAVDVGIDYLIARATGTDFNLVSSLKVNALVNVTTLGIGSTVTKLRHLGKLATLTATHGDDALRIGAKVAKEVAEEAAEQAGKEVAQEAVERAIKSEIRPARELVRESVPGTEVHHLIEQRFAKRFGVEPSDLPAIRLDKTFHQKEVTGRLFRGENLPTYPPRQYELQKIWNAYGKVYGRKLGRQDWLDAIWPFFADKGVIR